MRLEVVRRGHASLRSVLDPGLGVGRHARAREGRGVEAAELQRAAVARAEALREQAQAPVVEGKKHVRVGISQMRLDGREEPAFVAEERHARAARERRFAAAADGEHVDAVARRERDGGDGVLT